MFSKKSHVHIIILPTHREEKKVFVIKDIVTRPLLLYLLWSKSLPPTRLDCRQAKTDLTKCKKSAPRGNPTSGHRLNKSWVTILSVFLAFFFVICNMKNIILFREKHKHNELVKCPNPLISKTFLVYSKI